MALLDRTSDVLPVARPDHAAYRVIFETAAGLDYCRENLLARSLDAARVEVAALFANVADATARRAVTAFRLECW